MLLRVLDIHSRTTWLFVISPYANWKNALKQCALSQSPQFWHGVWALHWRALFCNFIFCKCFSWFSSKKKEKKNCLYKYFWILLDYDNEEEFIECKLFLLVFNFWGGLHDFRCFSFTLLTCSPKTQAVWLQTFDLSCTLFLHVESLSHKLRKIFWVFFIAIERAAFIDSLHHLYSRIPDLHRIASLQIQLQINCLRTSR